MSVSVRRVRVAVAGVMVAAVVVACAARPDPEPTPLVTTTEASPAVVVEPDPEPTPEETGEAPVPRTERPALVDEESDAGAIAAAEYFAVLAFETLRTQDLETWEALGTDSCGFCDAMSAYAAEAIALGQTYEGGVVTVRGESRIVGREETLGLVGVEVPVTITAQQLVSADGEAVEEWPQVEEYFYTELGFGYGGWQMTGAGVFAWQH